MYRGAAYTRDTHYFVGGVPTAYTTEQAALKATPLYPGAVWSNATMNWIEDRTLAQVKKDKRFELADAWDEEAKSGVTFGTKTAPTDDAGMQRYILLRLMAGESGWVDTPIPLEDGTWELMTLAKAQTLWAAIKDQTRTLLTKLRDKVLLVDAATTIEQVSNIYWED